VCGSSAWAEQQDDGCRGCDERHPHGKDHGQYRAKQTITASERLLMPLPAAVTRNRDERGYHQQWHDDGKAPFAGYIVEELGES
jgi:hypothetical protein